jgi:hypothetical protein
MLLYLLTAILLVVVFIILINPRVEHYEYSPYRYGFPVYPERYKKGYYSELYHIKPTTFYSWRDANYGDIKMNIFC